MRKKINTFLISLLFLFVFFSITQSQNTELDYPPIGGKGPGPGLKFFEYLYSAIISLAGILLLGQFIYAGIEWLISAEDVHKKESARERIKRSILGAVILLSSWLIMYTLFGWTGVITITPLSPPSFKKYDAFKNAKQIVICSEPCGKGDEKCVEENCTLLTPSSFENFKRNNLSINFLDFGHHYILFSASNDGCGIWINDPQGGIKVFGKSPSQAKKIEEIGTISSREFEVTFAEDVKPDSKKETVVTNKFLIIQGQPLNNMEIRVVSKDGRGEVILSEDENFQGKCHFVQSNWELVGSFAPWGKTKVSGDKTLPSYIKAGAIALIPSE